MLPVHFGHWRTAYGWFRELARRFLFQTIHDVELMLDRERAAGGEPLGGGGQPVGEGAASDRKVK